MTTALTYDQIATEVVNQCKRTVGYAEAQDKAAYLFGVSAATDRTHKIMQSQIETLQAEIDRLKEVQQDMKTLSNIITKYSDDH